MGESSINGRFCGNTKWIKMVDLHRFAMFDYQRAVQVAYAEQCLPYLFFSWKSSTRARRSYRTWRTVHVGGAFQKSWMDSNQITIQLYGISPLVPRFNLLLTLGCPWKCGYLDMAIENLRNMMMHQVFPPYFSDKPTVLTGKHIQVAHFKLNCDCSGSCSRFENLVV